MAKKISHEEFFDNHGAGFAELISAGVRKPGADHEKVLSLITQARAYMSISALITWGRFYKHASDATENDLDLAAYGQIDYINSMLNSRKARGGTRPSYDEMLALNYSAAIHAWVVAFSYRWVSGGMPIVTMTESVTSELVMSDPDDSELGAPWKAALIVPRVPIRVSENESIYACEIMLQSDGKWMSAVRTDRERYWAHGQSVSDLVLPHDLTGFGADSDSETLSDLGADVASRIVLDNHEHRISLLGRRLAVSAYRAISSGEPISKRVTGFRSSKRSADAARVPFGCKEYVLGKNIKISPLVAEAARDVALGTPKRNSVRWTVRGHFRNQACGPKLSERRKQWIRPFWKGPAGAPVMLRSHSL